MKVYVVADFNYHGGLLGVYADKTEADEAAEKHSWNHRHVIERYEYDVYEQEVRGLEGEAEPPQSKETMNNVEKG
ncbi:MAG: hypothetical protein NWE88_13440 [Candidatus Bathyarchaeota archaeon]|nr:hypothetical protein [Candidatus Bathyarchaeota archaeon]